MFDACFYYFYKYITIIPAVIKHTKFYIYIAHFFSKKYKGEFKKAYYSTAVLERQELQGPLGYNS